MAMVKIGRILPEAKGLYSAAAAYEQLDIVMSPDGAKAYMARRDVPAGTALTNTAYWQPYADLSALHAAMSEAKDAANEAAQYAAASADGAIRTTVRQDLSTSEKDTAQENIGLKEIVKGLTDGFEASGNPVQCNPVGGMLFDGVETQFSPKQEGSGDPYPAGGGKNLLPNTAITKTVNGVTFTVNEDGTITANGTATADAVLTLVNISENAPDFTGYTLSGCPDGGSPDTFFVRYSNVVSETVNEYGSGATIDCTYTGYMAVTARVKSGYTASNLVFKPMIRLAAETDANYAPYSNIRPISGWEELGLTRCRKNLFDPENITLGINATGAFASKRAMSALIPFVPPMTVSVTSLPDNLNWDIQFYTDDNYDSFHSSTGGAWDTGKTSVALDEAIEGVAFVGVLFGTVDNTTITDAAFDGLKLQIEHGTGTPYEPYAGTTHIVQIGQIVYGGRMNWLTGELTASWICETLDGVSKKFRMVGYLGDGTCYCNYKVPYAPMTANDEYKKSVMSHLSYGDEGYGYFYVSGAVKDEFFIYFKYFENLAAANQYLADQYAAGTPVQLAYPLASSTVIQLTPQQIAALQGVNTLFGDGDAIHVEGRQPKSVALEERIAALEAAVVSTV